MSELLIYRGTSEIGRSAVEIKIIDLEYSI